MNILVDAQCINNSNWQSIMNIIDDLRKNYGCRVSLYCHDNYNDENSINNSTCDFESIIFENEDLYYYQVFFSCCEECPLSILKEPHIVTVAFELSRGTEYKRSCLKGYDYCLLWNGFISALDEKNFFTGRILELDDLDEESLIQRQSNICINEVIKNLYEVLVNTIDRINEKPLVSVITITFNLIKNKREGTIKRCIESVHSQLYSNIEHIIIDGDSKDGTIDLLEEYQNRGWLRIESSPDNGIYDAMNKGIDSAKGKYVVFINSDDYFYDDRAVLSSIQLLNKTLAEYCFGDVYAVKEDGSIVEWIADINNLPYASHYCHQSMFASKELLQSIGGFDLNYPVSSDSDLMIRLFALGVKYCVIRRFISTYSLGGLSTERIYECKRDHALSFYIHIGKGLGLTLEDCSQIWGKTFLNTMPRNRQIVVLEKLGKSFNTLPLFENKNENSSDKISLHKIVKEIKHIIRKFVQGVFKIEFKVSENEFLHKKSLMIYTIPILTKAIPKRYFDFRR